MHPTTTLKKRTRAPSAEIQQLYEILEQNFHAGGQKTIRLQEPERGQAIKRAQDLNHAKKFRQQRWEEEDEREREINLATGSMARINQLRLPTIGAKAVRASDGKLANVVPADDPGPFEIVVDSPWNLRSEPSRPRESLQSMLAKYGITVAGAPTELPPAETSAFIPQQTIEEEDAMPDWLKPSD